MSVRVGLFNAYKGSHATGALCELLAAYSETAFNLCFQVLREPSVAEAVAQQALLQILKELEGLEDAASFEMRLHEICYKLALGVGPGRQGADTNRVIHEHVARLDPALRTVVVQYFFDQHTPEMVAMESGRTAAEISARIERAETALCESLRATGHETAKQDVDMFLRARLPARTPPDMISGEIITAANAVAAGRGLSGYALLRELMRQKMFGLSLSGVVVLLAGASIYIATRPPRQRQVAGPRRMKRAREPGSTPLVDGVGPGAAGQAAEGAAGEPDTVADLSVPDPLATGADGRSFADPLGLIAASAEQDTGMSGVAYGGETLRDAWTAGSGDIALASGTPLMEALSAVLLLQGENARSDALRALGVALSDEQFRTVYRALSENADATVFCRRLMEEWARSAPEAALRWAARQHTPGAAVAVLDVWIEQDLAAARAAAKRLPAGNVRARAMLRVQIVDEPAAAMNAVQEMQDPKVRRRLLAWAVACWAERAPAEAGEWAQRVPSRVERHGALRAVVRTWVKNEPEAGIQFAARVLEEEYVPGLKQSLAGGVVEKDPEYAARLSLRLAGQLRGVGNSALNASLARWAKADPVAAAAFVESLPLGQMRRAAAAAVGAVWSQTDPAKALAWVDPELSERNPGPLILPRNSRRWQGPPQDEQWRQVVLATAKTDQDLAFQLIQRIQTRSTRDKTAHELLVIWGSIDPRAARGAARQVRGWTRKEAPAWSVVEGWARLEPAAAAEYAQKLAGFQDKTHIVRNIAAQWRLRDPQGVAAWAQSLTPGPARLAALEGGTHAVAEH